MHNQIDLPTGTFSRTSSLQNSSKERLVAVHDGVKNVLHPTESVEMDIHASVEKVQSKRPVLVCCSIECSVRKILLVLFQVMDVRVINGVENMVIKKEESVVMDTRVFVRNKSSRSFASSICLSKMNSIERISR